MYEDQTFEAIMARNITAIKAYDSTIDTREGSLIYIATAICSAEEAQVYIDMDNILDITFADTAPREYLIKRAAERGLEPEPSTQAIVQGGFIPSTLSIAVGTRFSGNGVVYAVTEYVSDGVYKLQCETAGTVGNEYLGDIVPVVNVPGLTACSITEILIPGENVEDTEVFRQRYFDSFQSQAYGGNIDDYKEKVKSLGGVGGVKVYPVWNGGGTVKCVLIDSSFGVPSSELIATVQEAIDPVGAAGEGVGIAPIGHTVTIDGVTESSIDIAATITYTDGWDFASCESYINAAIDAYFLELAQTWEDTKTLLSDAGLIVRISQIETRLLDLTGILDISGTTINTVASNFTLGVAEIPVRGTVSG